MPQKLSHIHCWNYSTVNQKLTPVSKKLRPHSSWFLRCAKIQWHHDKTTRIGGGGNCDRQVLLKGNQLLGNSRVNSRLYTSQAQKIVCSWYTWYKGRLSVSRTRGYWLVLGGGRVCLQQQQQQGDSVFRTASKQETKDHWTVSSCNDSWANTALCSLFSHNVDQHSSDAEWTTSSLAVSEAFDHPQWEHFSTFFTSCTQIFLSLSTERHNTRQASGFRICLLGEISLSASKLLHHYAQRGNKWNFPHVWCGVARLVCSFPIHGWNPDPSSTSLIPVAKGNFCVRTKITKPTPTSRLCPVSPLHSCEATLSTQMT